MIRKVNSDEMQDCANVIKESFSSVAVKFNITKENAPNYVAFSTTPDRLTESISADVKCIHMYLINILSDFFR